MSNDKKFRVYESAKDFRKKKKFPNSKAEAAHYVNIIKPHIYHVGDRSREALLADSFFNLGVMVYTGKVDVNTLEHLPKDYKHNDPKEVARRLFDAADKNALAAQEIYWKKEIFNERKEKGFIGGHPHATHYLGLIALDTHGPAQAKPYFEKASLLGADTNNHSPEALLWLADYYLSQDKEPDKDKRVAEILSRRREEISNDNLNLSASTLKEYLEDTTNNISDIEKGAYILLFATASTLEQRGPKSKTFKLLSGRVEKYLKTLDKGHYKRNSFELINRCAGYFQTSAHSKTYDYERRRQERKGEVVTNSDVEVSSSYSDGLVIPTEEVGGGNKDGRQEPLHGTFQNLVNTATDKDWSRIAAELGPAPLPPSEDTTTSSSSSSDSDSETSEQLLSAHREALAGETRGGKSSSSATKGSSSSHQTESRRLMLDEGGLSEEEVEEVEREFAEDGDHEVDTGRPDPHGSTAQADESQVGSQVPTDMGGVTESEEEKMKRLRNASIRERRDAMHADEDQESDISESGSDFGSDTRELEDSQEVKGRKQGQLRRTEGLFNSLKRVKIGDSLTPPTESVDEQRPENASLPTGKPSPQFEEKMKALEALLSKKQQGAIEKDFDALLGELYAEDLEDIKSQAEKLGEERTGEIHTSDASGNVDVLQLLEALVEERQVSPVTEASKTGAPLETGNKKKKKPLPPIPATVSEPKPDDESLERLAAEFLPSEKSGQVTSESDILFDENFWDRMQASVDEIIQSSAEQADKKEENTGVAKTSDDLDAFTVLLNELNIEEPEPSEPLPDITIDELADQFDEAFPRGIIYTDEEVSTLLKEYLEGEGINKSVDEVIATSVAEATKDKVPEDNSTDSLQAILDELVEESKTLPPIPPKPALPSRPLPKVPPTRKVTTVEGPYQPRTVGENEESMFKSVAEAVSSKAQAAERYISNHTPEVNVGNTISSVQTSVNSAIASGIRSANRNLGRDRRRERSSGVLNVSSEFDVAHKEETSEDYSIDGEAGEPKSFVEQAKEKGTQTKSWAEGTRVGSTVRDKYIDTKRAVRGMNVPTIEETKDWAKETRAGSTVRDNYIDTKRAVRGMNIPTIEETKDWAKGTRVGRPVRDKYVDTKRALRGVNTPSIGNIINRLPNASSIPRPSINIDRSTFSSIGSWISSKSKSVGL